MPVTTVEASTGLKSLRLDELIGARELLFFLAWRDVKVRYRQTALGVAWVILQPLVLMSVLYVLFSRVAAVGSEGSPYWLFALVALVPWTMFSQSVADAAMSLVASSNLVSKVYFPRLLLPLASVVAHLVDLVIGLLMLIVLLIAFGPGISARITLLPFFALLATAVALSIGIGLAALNVRYRDVRYVIPFMIQLLLFLSPVAYSFTELRGWLRWVYSLNPMVGVIEGFRWTMLQVPRNPTDVVLISAASTALLLMASILYFKRVERTFADVI